jgi:para-nitrobenzyl esterase
MQHSWRPFTAGDKELSVQMVDYWTNFAKSGNPNGKSGDVWKSYTTQNPQFLVMDADGNKAQLMMTTSPMYKGNVMRR